MAGLAYHSNEKMKKTELSYNVLKLNICPEPPPLHEKNHEAFLLFKLTLCSVLNYLVL